MYAQITTLKSPMGKMAQLRRLIDEVYLPDVQKREGFISAHFLEQIDDPDTAQLIMYWETQADLERSRQTSMLRQTLEGLAAELPGLRIQKQGYSVELQRFSRMAQARA